MLDVLCIRMRWDGSVLRAQVEYEQGWELLTNTARPSSKLGALPCFGVRDTTGFEIETLLYQMQRQVGDEWINARITEAEESGLFPVQDDLT